MTIHKLGTLPVTAKQLALIVFPVAAFFSVTPWVSSGGALALGLALAVTLGNPYAAQAKRLTHPLLALSVMGLGAGMNLEVVGKVGLEGMGYTVIGILSAIIVGTLLGSLLQTEKNTSLLLTIGTAICGGSAIAAVAPVIRAKDHEVSVAIGIVFMLNATALFLFPWVGHYLDLNQTQFGLWSALAIHDTSSVVGATLQYGPKALEVGTTIKLARALWIIPVALIIGIFRSHEKNDAVKHKTVPKRPWFILGFLMAAALVTYVPELQTVGHLIESAAKHLMVLTLFLIGSGLTKSVIYSVGVLPFIQAIVLWFVMASGSLAAICFGIIR
jgi:uncharacterized integral membrane protein (TIGR00698 family)